MAIRDFRRACVPALVGGVALTTALGVGAVATAPAPAHVASDVGLKALITHGSATNWNADGIDKFYGLDWNEKYGPTVVSQFSLFPYNVNPDNLKAALRNNVGDPEPDLVLTSGRGSGAATVTMLLLLNSGRPEDRELVLNTRWILDNSVNRPNGGYGSRYIPFSILGVYPWPTPTDEGVDIVDVGYEYAWNSSAPAYVTNVVALLNSIIAYAYRYKSQAFTGLPVDPALGIDPVTGEPKLEKGYHYIVEVDGTVTKEPLKSLGNTNTAYVTYRADGLPMLQPLRDFGGQFGNAVADLLQPALKVIVDASYPGGNPWPTQTATSRRVSSPRPTWRSRRSRRCRLPFIRVSRTSRKTWGSPRRRRPRPTNASLSRNLLRNNPLRSETTTPRRLPARLSRCRRNLPRNPQRRRSRAWPTPATSRTSRTSRLLRTPRRPPTSASVHARFASSSTA